MVFRHTIKGNDYRCSSFCNKNPVYSQVNNLIVFIVNVAILVLLRCGKRLPFRLDSCLAEELCDLAFDFLKLYGDLL